jgi:hypothetical protein
MRVSTVDRARAPGARVHGGPPIQNEGVRDQSRPCKIQQPWTHACGMRRQHRRSVAAHGGSSPALRLGGVPGHQHDRRIAQNVEGTHVHVFVGSRGRLCLGGGRHRKGAERPLWRARECAGVHKRKGKRAGFIAHSSKERRASSKVKKMRRRRSLAMAAGRAALRCGRGAAPTGLGDENLQQFELDEPLVNPRRKKEGRRRLSFTCGDEFTTAAAGTRGGNAGELVLERVSWCAEKAKGGTGIRARA